MTEPEARLDLIAAIAKDDAWGVIVKIGQIYLDTFYPESVFTGESGDLGPEYVVALRNVLRRVQDR